MAISASSRTTRILPIPIEERMGRTLDLLKASRRGRTVDQNIYATLVRNQRLFERWLSLGHALLFEGSLTGRDRELLVLRTAANCESEYEWAQHQKYALAGGISEDEVSAIYGDWRERAWSPKDYALLSAADELHEKCVVGDASWGKLASHFPEEQLIELTMVVGVYHLVAMMLNSFGVQLDDGLRGFPE
jgi:alkylhydroperoxidase family enzyme